MSSLAPRAFDWQRGSAGKVEVQLLLCGVLASCHILRQDLGGKLLNGSDSSWLQLWAGAQRR